jgi:uncharacterized RDD family membrane protein YckC
MRDDDRPEGSPYPKADLTLRALARLVDSALAVLLVVSAPPVGPFAAALYLLAADSLFHGQSPGKRLFGVRVIVVPRRAPAGVQESLLRNSPFALVAVFASVPWLWLIFFVAGLLIVAFESYLVFTDRLGIRIGDVFADTQVVDAKVLAQAEERRALATPAPARPSSSASV